MKLLNNERVTHTLGTAFMHRMDEVIFILNPLRITRRQLVEIAAPFPSMRCARVLYQLCEQHGIRSMKGLFTFGPTALASMPGVGEMTLWVAMCLLDHAGFSVSGWFQWQARTRIVTWRTQKHRAAKTEEAA